MKSREQITCNGRAAFYASIFDDLRNAAMNCGWALGLHGSLSSDMDIMAMPWTENAEPVEVMIQALSDCFEGNPFKDTHTVPHYEKPNNRVVYTMAIWEDFYLDINVIESEGLPHSGICEWKTSMLKGYKTSCGYNIMKYKGEPIEEAIEKLERCPKCGKKIKRVPCFIERLSMETD